MSQPSKLTDPALTRRSLFSLSAAGALSARMPVTYDPALATGHAGIWTGRPDRPTLDVAAPRDSALGAWARLLQPPLASGLTAPHVLDLRYAGGVTGVTAANQFDARAMPDGSVALLFCGGIPLAWLTGSGVRLNPDHLLPVFAAFGPSVLMVRGPLPDAGARRRKGAAPPAPLLVATGPRPDAGLVALLGLDLLGIPAIAADPALSGPEGGANAVFLQGPEARTRRRALMAAGFRPVFSVWQPAAAGSGATGSRDAPDFLAALPAARLRQDRLVVAWRAMAASCALCAAVAVPALTPPDALDRWRGAARRGKDDVDVAARALGQGLHLVAGAAAADALSPMRVDEAARAALRGWMAARLPA